MSLSHVDTYQQYVTSTVTVMPAGHAYLVLLYVLAFLAGAPPPS